LDPAQLTVSDWFAPFNFQSLSDGDEDFGTMGAMLIPGTNYLLTGGKAGVVYLMDRTALGHTNANDSQILQTLNLNNFGVFNMALWNRPDGPLVYTHVGNAPVVAFRMNGGQLSNSPVAQSINGSVVPFQGMTLSANGTQPGTGVLWVTGVNTWPLPANGVLHAYNADGLGEIWNSAMNDADAMGGFVKFANPTVANGKVYVPTMDYQLLVYGMKYNTVSKPGVTAIVNAGSYAGGAVAPGEMVAIYGQNLGPANLVTATFTGSGNMNTQLYGTQVTFNGIAAPLVYASAGAIAAIVPYEISGASSASVVVSYNGQVAAAQTIPLVDAFPGLFSIDASGRGPGAILNADYSLNADANPAAAGSVVIIYATGGGQTNPPSSSGNITIAAMALAGDVSVTVGGQPAQVLYAGNAGGEVAGVTQINLQLPAGVTGTVPVTVTVGGNISQTSVTVSIR
ncbi:MAG TPA: IPT/TIG domain-containing protein, partial [Bryobacteraceae bacterium]|nr:IPT/TIG domain-containing protein [Bryobacteraceae bacterium]